MWPLARKTLLALLPAAGLLARTLSASGAELVRLPSFNIETNQISVSGLSSGGYMAVQFDVAFSSVVRGAGIIAGGPYYCAQGSSTIATTTCSCFFGCLATSSTDIAQLVAVTDRNAARGAIDDTANLARHRIWLFSGTSDTIVPQHVMDDLVAYYRHYVGAANIAYKNDIAAEHAMPTDFFGNPCGILNDPYINNCDYDASGQLLQWIHGSLNPKNAGALAGSFVHFDQGEFIDHPTDHGMAPDGWLFVPAGCAKRQSCKLHVAFHACKQYETYRYFSPSSGLVTFGTTFVRNTGYNKWADTNNIIVLYPQAIASSPLALAPNPYGCWDWWGYDGANYALKSGRQMATVKAMVDRIVCDSARPGCNQRP
jgi:poly(3-hydroxybutyrate) depolymerase